MSTSTTVLVYSISAVYQGLIRSCSHPVVIETQEQQSENSDETDLTVKPVTYRDFLELWSGLLESPSIKVKAKTNKKIPKQTANKLSIS